MFPTAGQCKKGDEISTFLEKCRQQFPELRGVGVDNLMYVKEDLIIPHVSTFPPKDHLATEYLFKLLMGPILTKKFNPLHALSLVNSTT